MRSLYQVLKASKIDPVSAPDMFTALWAKNISGSGSVPTEHEYTGTVPTPITANGEPLIEWILKGNLVQSGQPSAEVVNVYPPIDDNSINRGGWGTTAEYDRYLPSEPAYFRSQSWAGLGNEVYLDIGTWTFSVYVKADYPLDNAANISVYESSDLPHYSESATVSEMGVAIPTITQTYQRFTFTFDVTTAGYVFPIIKKTDDSGTGIFVTCWQLERGSTATPYIAYGKSIISPIYPSETGDRTSNLIFKTISSANISPTGVIQTLSGFNLNIAKVKQGQAYSGDGYVYAFFASEPTMGDASYNAERVVNSCKNVTAPIDGYLAIRVPNDAENQMINEGSTIKPYEPYGFKLPVQCGGVTTPVYTAEPLRKIGDYTDYKSNSAEYRVVKKLVLTGGEVTTVDASVKQALISISGDLKASGITPISTHYVGKVVTAWTQLSNGEVGLSSVGTTIRICDTTHATSATAFNNYLTQQYANGTPVCIWYVLATPTTESITAPEIPTTAGSQTFDVDTTLKPSEVYIKYKG